MCGLRNIDLQTCRMFIGVADLIDWVQSVLSLVDYHKRPNLSTSLLLAPSCYEQISNRVSVEILGGTFQYIGKCK